MEWAGSARAIVETVLAASALPADELTAGEYEVRAGVHGAVDGMQFAGGIHGRLTVGTRQRPLESLIATALAMALAKVPAAARKQFAKDLAKLAAAADPANVELLPEARKILQRMRKKTGVEWHDTPTYKPRG